MGPCGEELDGAGPGCTVTGRPVAAHLDAEHCRLLLQLAKLQIAFVGSIAWQEAEPVRPRRAARHVPVSQVQLVDVGLQEPGWRRQRRSPQQKLSVPGQQRDDEGQVGRCGIRVGEPQKVGGHGGDGAVLQTKAGVDAEGWRDAVAAFDGEEERAGAGRGAVGNDEAAERKYISNVQRPLLGG